MIPKIIHQTAKNKKLSWEERMLRKRAMKLMPDYDFKLYDDQENRAIVAKHFPEYLSKYDNINKGVAKVDVIRLIYMYLWGGYYCDTDYKWLASPDKFSLNECICILPISRGQKDNIECLGNAVFGSEPKIEFWKDFIDYLFQDSEISQLQENRIEKVTGPEGLTKFFLANRTKYPYITLPQSNMFHPRLKGVSALTDSSSIGIHHCWSSWRSGSFKDKLKIYIKRKITAIN